MIVQEPKSEKTITLTVTALVLFEHELMLILDAIFTSNDREELMEAVLKYVEELVKQGQISAVVMLWR